MLLLREELLVTGSVLASFFFLSEVRSPGLAEATVFYRLFTSRAAIGLFEPLGLASLGGCVPLPLSLGGSTTRAFSGYRAVLGTRSLDIPVIWCFIMVVSSRHFFLRWNITKVVGEHERIRPSVVSSIRKTDQSHRRI